MSKDLQDRLADLEQRLASAEARIAELSDWYWDGWISHLLMHPSNAGVNNAAGDIVACRPLHELPTVYMLITGDGPKMFSTLAEAEKAKEKE